MIKVTMSEIQKQVSMATFPDPWRYSWASQITVFVCLFHQASIIMCTCCHKVKANQIKGQFPWQFTGFHGNLPQSMKIFMSNTSQSQNCFRIIHLRQQYHNANVYCYKVKVTLAEVKGQFPGQQIHRDNYELHCTEPKLFSYHPS